MAGRLAIHRGTPTLTVIDPRGHRVRSVAYLRAAVDDVSETRATRFLVDATGRPVAHWDPRLGALGEGASPNQRTVPGLAGAALRSDNVDAGWRVALPGPAGEPCERWDGRGTRLRTVHDALARPVAVYERMAAGAERCAQRFTYASASTGDQSMAGRLLRHDDDAGCLENLAFDLHGASSRVRRRFLVSLDAPDWPAGDLETTPFDTVVDRDALGAPVGMRDARGHARRFHVDIGGRTASATLRPQGADLMTVVAAIVYDAQGHVVGETAGNGVVTEATHEAATGRLRRLRRTRSGRVLQDLTYDYDPVGNVLACNDAAQPTEWFAGKRVDPVNRYAYDTLYQLVEASGRESIGAAGGPALPDLALPGDGSRLRNYTESYAYDAAGNLSTRRHTANGGSYTRAMHIAPDSNRSVADDGAPPAWATAFDANGNQRVLQPGQALVWDGSDRLSGAVLVARDGAANDDERYVYAGPGERVRKLARRTIGGTVRQEETRYLPGLECHTNEVTGTATETMTLQAGHVAFRIVRQAGTTPTDAPRYQVGDLLGSIALELDGDGAIVTYEGHLPYGGTAWWAGRDDTKAGAKARRYSGRERDATGLYFYGYRYYAPWLARWLSTDPAGDVDGVNRYVFVLGNPMSRVDFDGRQGTDDYDEYEKHIYDLTGSHLSRGIAMSSGLDGARTRAVDVARAGLQLALRIVEHADAALKSEPNAHAAQGDGALAEVLRLNPAIAVERTTLSNWRKSLATAMPALSASLRARNQSGADAVVWFSNEDEARSATTMPGDPKARIFLNTEAMHNVDSVDMAKTFIHESTHLLFRTEDIVYGSSYRSEAPPPVASAADLVSRYSGDIGRLAAYVPPPRSLMSAPVSDGESSVIAALGGASRYERLSSMAKRTQLHRRNADTLAILTMIYGAAGVAHSGNAACSRTTIAFFPRLAPARGVGVSYQALTSETTTV